MPVKLTAVKQTIEDLYTKNLKELFEVQFSYSNLFDVIAAIKNGEMSLYELNLFPEENRRWEIVPLTAAQTQEIPNEYERISGDGPSPPEAV